MRIALTGATGFIGGRLAPLLTEHKLVVFGRKKPLANTEFVAWDALHEDLDASHLDGVDAVIHLAGEPVAQRWNPESKRRIRDSRVEGTRRLVAAFARMKRRPGTLVSASAVGFYGDRGEETLTENSAPGRGFLPDVCVEWEREASAAAALDVRVTIVRIGIVLGRGGGALAEMAKPFRFGVGAQLGDGRQWMPWIHANDLAAILRCAATDERWEGVMNAVSPQPVRNADFTVSLARAMHRPALFRAPRFALQLLAGEMAQILFASQRVLPARTQAAPYQFQHTDLDETLRGIFAA